MVTAVFMLCGEHTALSSPWKVRLQSHPPACIFPAAHTDCFADTTMSKGPGFHLYIPLIYFKFLKKIPCSIFHLQFFSCTKVSQREDTDIHRVAVQQPPATKHSKDHSGSSSQCHVREGKQTPGTHHQTSWLL